MNSNRNVFLIFTAILCINFLAILNITNETIVTGALSADASVLTGVFALEQRSRKEEEEDARTDSSDKTKRD